MGERYSGPERRAVRDWHLDKRVSITIILTLIIQGSSFIWYAATLDAAVRHHSKQIEDVLMWKSRQDDLRSGLESKLATVDQRLNDQKELLQRIDDRLERMMFPKR